MKGPGWKGNMMQSLY